MRQINANDCESILLGRQGENLATRVIFDISEWKVIYGNGTPRLMYRPPSSTTTSEVTATVDGNYVFWDVTSAYTDISYGCGACELWYYAGDTLVKSRTWITFVDNSMDVPEGTTPPLPAQSAADRRKFAEKVMLYYGYPNAINNSWDVNNSANIYKDYDVCIFGDGYCLPTHEAHAETVEIFRILKRIAPDTRIVGYVPIGVQNVGSDSNLPMDELKNRVDLWQSIGADGIFLDEYGYDYGVTRARQNEIVSYCHDRGMFVFANSWSIEYCFSDEDIMIDGMEDFHPNPDGLRAVLNAQDYYVYEHLFYNSYHDGDGNLHVECAEPYRIDNILQYFHDVRIDGKSYREMFGTKVFSLDAIPTGASLREKNEMMSLSIIGAAILNIDAIAFGDDMWSSSGNYHQWDFPQLNLETGGLNSISRSTRTYTDTEGNPAEFTYRWAASINGNQYAIVFDVETPTDVDYVVGKRYAECNGVRVDNAWLTIYDFQEFMDSTATQVETNTMLVNETVQKVENALPNALQAEEKVNAFMTASDARIEDMESRVNSSISDIEVLTKGFNYLEVEW